MIAENLKILQKRIEKSCHKCGRSVEDVHLIAVSKTFSAEVVQETVAAGQTDFGENFVQELQGKRQMLGEQRIRWHFIGHLQSNKVKYIAEYVHLIHSVDDLSLGNEINKRASQYNRMQDILVEVHTTHESTKYGVLPAKAVELVKDLSQLSHVRVCGLMTMGPFSDDPNDSRVSFQQLVAVQQQINKEGIEHVQMRHLSMGMTHDFEVAIEEGATLVRIGTAVFGTRVKNAN